MILVSFSGLRHGEERESSKERKNQPDWKAAAVYREEQGRGEPRNSSVEDLEDSGSHH